MKTNHIQPVEIKRRTPKVKNKGCKIVNQDREMARRKVQIANGQLKPENGLVS